MLGIALVFALGLVHLLEAVTNSRIVQYKEFVLRAEKLPAELEGYTLAFITDTHRLSDEDTRAMIDRINARGVDAALLGGDYQSFQRMEEHIALLSGIRTADGIYSVEGNHDDADRLRAAMEARGMGFLYNDGLYLREGLYLGGTADLWNGEPDVAAALDGYRQDGVALLLCHNPDVAEEQPCENVDLMLSGHTHGGLVNILGLRSIAMNVVSNYGQKFRHGLVHANCDVLVSSGVGSIRWPRVFSPPEMWYVVLEKA